MVTAIVLIKSERDQIPELAQKLASMKGVSEVFSVAGRYDLVAVVKVRQMDDLADVVSGEMRKQKEILETETLIAFRAFSNREMEAGFDLGLD